MPLTERVACPASDARKLRASHHTRNYTIESLLAGLHSLAALPTAIMSPSLALSGLVSFFTACTMRCRSSFFKIGLPFPAGHSWCSGLSHCMSQQHTSWCVLCAVKWASASYRSRLPSLFPTRQSIKIPRQIGRSKTEKSVIWV